MSNVEPLHFLQQTAILDTNQLIAYIKPISKRIYWSVMTKDPRFPKPVIGGNGVKALHSREKIDDYLAEVGRTGFMAPDHSEVRDAA